MDCEIRIAPGIAYIGCPGLPILVAAGLPILVATGLPIGCCGLDCLLVAVGWIAYWCCGLDCLLARPSRIIAN